MLPAWSWQRLAGLAALVLVLVLSPPRVSWSPAQREIFLFPVKSKNQALALPPPHPTGGHREEEMPLQPAVHL